MPDGVIAIDDPRAPEVRALLERHLAFALETTPSAADRHALDVDALVDPAVTFFSYRAAGAVLGVAAIKQLGDGQAEIKSMHTAAEARGRGVGRALVEHLLAVARARGYVRVSLETGSGQAFAPARALYAQAGFSACPPFAGYVESPNSTYMTRTLHP